MLNSYHSQQGVGLLEVMVALLLLSVGVLGFSVMQMQAIKATDETLMRSDAMVAVRNLSEDLRLLPNAAQKEAYLKVIADTYNGQLKNNQAPTASNKCTNQACNLTQRMQDNVSQALSLAFESGVKINAMTCANNNSSQQTLQKICLIAAWGDTEPTQGGGNKDCITPASAYRAGATCFVMETY